MKEKPILFSTEMIRAILDRQKIQTRRIVKNPPFDATDEGLDVQYLLGNLKSPYEIGMRLWVRETTCIEDLVDGKYKIYYKATEDKPNHLRWKPSIFMPRHASRITLEIIDLKIERLQDITMHDAEWEGDLLMEPICGIKIINTKATIQKKWQCLSIHQG